MRKCLSLFGLIISFISSPSFSIGTINANIWCISGNAQYTPGQTLSPWRSRIQPGYNAFPIGKPGDSFTVTLARDAFIDQQGNFLRVISTAGLASWAASYSTFFRGVGANSQARYEAKMNLDPSGYTYNGKTIYQLPDNPNIGIMIRFGNISGYSDFNHLDKDWHQFAVTNNVGLGAGSPTMPMRVHVTPVLIGTPKDRQIKGARSDVASQIIAYIRHKNYRCDSNRPDELISYSADIPVRLNNFYLKQQISSCDYTDGDINVPLPTVGTSSFKGNGSEVYGSTFNINLKRCGLLNADNAVENSAIQAVYVTFSDVQNPGNTGDILTTETGNAAAKGVGLRIYAAGNATPIKYGTASRDIRNRNAVPMNYDRNAYNVSQRYIVHYVQTADQMTSGNVNAKATFTFSYR